MNEQEAEDIDQPSDKDENTAILREKAVRGPLVTFPTEDEFQAWYIWRHDAYFEVLFDQIRPDGQMRTRMRTMAIRSFIT